VAVEIDPVLADYLRIAHSHVEVIVGDAVDLEGLLAVQHISAVDVVISGLPWSLIDPEAQRVIVDATARCLAPTGCFTTFAYVHGLSMPWARQFRVLLGEIFDEVLITRTVWWNLPPAVTYVCRRPRAGLKRRCGRAQ
jgi:phospholipid N-methyltransferase